MNDYITVVILIYVESDLIIGGDCMTEISKLNFLLEMQFHMKDLGELKHFLSMEIIRSENGIYKLQK